MASLGLILNYYNNYTFNLYIKFPQLKTELSLNLPFSASEMNIVIMFVIGKVIQQLLTYEYTETRRRFRMIEILFIL
jgi:hypothetical protein